MARKSQAQIKQDRIRMAMTPLVGLPQFASWIAMITELKDEAVAYSVDSETVKSDRESLVVKGEIRTYLNIINTFKGEVEQQEAAARAMEAERLQTQD
jgi:hypothetical protein